MIQSKIIKQEVVAWRLLKWFQSEDLKTITPEELAKLKASLKNNSFIQPFNVWDDGEQIWILDGHHRYMAMTELIREGVVISNLLPANFIECANRQEAAKMVIVYSGIYAQISKQGLSDFAVEHQLDLSALALEIELPQFDLAVLANTTAEEQSGSDEVIPEVEEIAVTQPGDLWELGPHRLKCGDSLNRIHVHQLMHGDEPMNGHLARIVFTDPPYNVSINHISVAAKSGDSPHGNFAMASGEMSKQQFTEFLSKTLRNLIDFSEPGSIHYVCMDWRHIEELLAAGKQYTEFKQLVVWNKSAAGMGTFYRSKHELVFIFKNGDEPHINNFKLGGEGRYRTNVWDYEGAIQFSSRQSATEGTMSMHPTVKPLKMVSDALLDCSNVGDVVLDLFGGSGTTLIAAELTARRARLMEIDCRYCDVIVKRYIQHCSEAGKTPVVFRNGESVSIEDFAVKTQKQG